MYFKLVPNTIQSFLIFAAFAVLLLQEVEFFPFFLLLREIQQVLLDKMGTNVTQITFDVHTFLGLDLHRKLIRSHKSHSF